MPQSSRKHHHAFHTPVTSPKKRRPGHGRRGSVTIGEISGDLDDEIQPELETHDLAAADADQEDHLSDATYEQSFGS